MKRASRWAAPATPTSSRFNIDLAGLFTRITPQDLALMTRQLATLVGAGLPLVECLGALIEQVDSPKQKKILSQVRERVVEGGNLADAMKAHPAVFNDLYVNMVRAGEASGALDLVLIRLSEYTERAAALRAKVRSALTYPVFMGLASSAILFFLLSYVVPKVTRIFAETHAQLPAVTLVLLAISGFLSNYWWLVIGLVLLLVLAVRVSTRSPAGRLRFDRLTLRIPYFGKVLKKVALARFARTLSTLLLGGIPLLQSLDIVKHVVNNLVLSNAIEDGRNSIREGHSVADPLKKSGLFPPLARAHDRGRREERRARVDAGARCRRLRWRGRGGGIGTEQHHGAPVGDFHGRCRAVHRHGDPAADLRAQPTGQVRLAAPTAEVRSMRRLSLQTGMTLIEIMVVVFIIGLLVTLVAPRIIGRTDEARVTKAKADIKAIEEAANMFKLDNGFYPTTAEGLAAFVQPPPRAKKFNPDGYLSNIPRDPWGNEYIYQSDGRVVIVLSLGADGVEGGEGYNADIDSRALD